MVNYIEVPRGYISDPSYTGWYDPIEQNKTGFLRECVILIIADKDGVFVEWNFNKQRERNTLYSQTLCQDVKSLHAIRIDDGDNEALTKINLQRKKKKEDMLRSIIAKVGIYMGKKKGGRGVSTLHDNIRK